MRRSLATASLAAFALLAWAGAARVQPYSMYSPYPPASSPYQGYQPYPPPPAPYQGYQPYRRPPPSYQARQSYQPAPAAYQPPPPTASREVDPEPRAAPAQASADAANPAAQPAPPTGALQTPSAYGHSNVTHAVEAPFHDLNITGQTIPDVLLLAMADPYARLPAPGCAEINDQIAGLTAALGPDFDEAGTPEDPSIRGKMGPTALALVHSAAESVLPFNSYVSTLSGAQRRDALVNRAINAGGIRRGYLKGLGESRGCQPPGAPQHLLNPAPPVNDHSRPIYAIH